MVKNIPTIERSTKIRFGKYATDDQGENTIVFNASNAAIDTSGPGSIYMTPLRSEDIRNTDVKILTYNRTTKEVLDSNVTSDDIFSMNLEFVTNNDNVTSNTVRFINDTTAFVTTGNVGIHNTSPTHALDVGSNVYVTKDGEVRVGPSILINSSVTNKIQVSGRIDTDSITLDHIGLSNNNPTITGLSLGSSTFLRHPTDSINAFSTSGNVSAAFYHGDSYFLSNLNLNNIVLQGNTTASRTVQFNYANGPALITNGNVGIQNTHGIHTLDVGSNLFVDDIGSDILNVTGNVNATNYLKSKKLEVSEDAIISGNVNASGNIETTSGFFKGDGGILSNVTLQQVTDAGNTTSNTVQFTNAHTAFTTDLTSNVGVKLNQLSNVNVTGLVEDNILIYDGSNWLNDYNVHNFVKIKNETGDTLYRGNTVYIVDGHNANVANVALAKSNSPNTMPCIGVIHDDISDQNEGVAVAYGKVQNVNTGGFTEGEIVYVSNTNAGSIMNSKPFGASDLIQNVGICVKADSSHGVIFVTGVGRSNDIPNAQVVTDQPSYVYVNSIGNELKKINPRILNANNQTLDMVTSWSNSTTNTIASTNTTTGFISSGNVHVGSNIQVSGLSSGFVPIVGSDKFLHDSVIEYSGDTTTISSNVEITGNLLVLGNTFTVESNSLVINDRVLGIANNNVSHSLDVGIIMEHPGHNIAFIHHGEPAEGDPHEHEMVLGYTQNTVSDNHVLDDANLITFRVLGNVIVQNNLTLTSGDLTAITVNSNVVGDNVSAITLNGNVSGDNVNAITLYGNVSGDNVSVITLNGNVSGDNVSAITLYGNVSGDNVNAITLNGNVSGDNVSAITLNGNVSGDNVNAITLYGNVSGDNVNTITLYGNVNGNNVDVITLTGNVIGNNVDVITLYGNVSGDNVNAITLNGNVVSDNVVATNGIYGNILGSNAISASTIYVGTSTPTPSLGDYELRVEGDTEITGNLLVGGTTTTVNTQNLIVQDPIIQLGNAVASVDSGLLLARPITSPVTGNVYVGYDQSESEFAIGFTSNHAGESSITVKDGVNFKMNVYGNVEASYFFGDGSQLSGIQTATPTLESVVDEGNATSNVVLFTNTTTGIKITSNIAFDDKITLQSLTSGSKNGFFVVDTIQLDPSYADSSLNVLSYNTTTGEIYDSGGQGGSSFNNISEEGANVLIGSNLTINTFGSNVLTVSGNVSADNITIGGLNVAASPFALDDVVSVYEGANVTANVLTLGGVVTNVVTANTITLANNLTVSGNTTSQNIKLTNTDITASVTSGTITVDAKEKTYGTSPLVVSTTDVSNLVFSNLITGAQIVIPILASGGAINISSAMTNVNFYAMTSDVSVTQDKHALMTLSNLYGNIYMNAIGFS